MKYMILFGIITMFCVSQTASAQIPQTISYQGLLTTPGGTPVADNNYSLIFRLYGVNIGGTPLWTETQPSIPVVKGIFNVILGSVIPLTLAFDQQYWLGVTISGGSEFSPRIQLTSTPYSLNARTIADNAVTSSKIASGQVVKSLNSLKDNVTLAAGANITITPGGNTLTISSSGGTGSGWSLTGNSGTNPANNFLGTTDNQALELRVNNLRSLRLEPHPIGPNIIGGFSGNSVISGAFSATIGGGGAMGGLENKVNRSYGTIGGGMTNTITGMASTISGGGGNNGAGHYSTIGGGKGNEIVGDDNVEGATIGGGFNNTTSAKYATISGGGPSPYYDKTKGNRVTDNYGTVSGGGHNLAGDDIGETNTAEYATISGGKDNKANASFSTVGGGSNNFASASYATIGGGGSSNAADPNSGNLVTDDYGTVGGGGNNLAGNNDGSASNKTYATVGGGQSNIASGSYSFVGGGQTNVASGNWSTVPGGLHNAATGSQSFAAGTRAYANGVGSFVWGDSNALDIYAHGPNQFVCRATGGFWFITKVDDTGYPIEGMQLLAGTSSWFPIGSTTLAVSQTQDNQIQKLEEENIALKKRVDELESRLTALEKLLYATDQKQ